MSGIRKDVASLGPGWNKTLLNYALAMHELVKLPIADRASWKFLAAMHGIDVPGWVNFGVLPNAQLPNDLKNQTYGDQCQHGSWYFLPWHRAYLAAFEAIVAAKVKEINGDDWALPYWNYLDSSNPDALKIPDAFVADKLPDGSDNPLAMYPRDPGITELPRVPPQYFSLQAMAEDDFVVAGGLGFGGAITDNFVHFSNTTKGRLERNPHDTVHGLILGFMGDPRYAGLDPIFWLHHCNIDRLWEAWMRTPGKKMVSDQRWSDGPADRRFIMPQPDGTGMNFTARDTLKGGKYHPTYDDLTKGTGVQPGVGAVARIGMGPSDQQTVEVIGSNDAAIEVRGASASTIVRMEPVAATAGIAAMGATEPGQQIARLYLKLDGIKGEAPSPLLDVYLNLPEGEEPEDHPELLVGGLALFGLNVASEPDGVHAGNGLSYSVDITDAAQALAAGGGFNPEGVRVTLVPRKGITEATPVTVDNIEVLKRTGTVS